VQTFTHELRYPATTDAAHLASEMAKRPRRPAHERSVFTYHSIDVISKARRSMAWPILISSFVTKRTVPPEPPSRTRMKALSSKCMTPNSFMHPSGCI